MKIRSTDKQPKVPSKEQVPSDIEIGLEELNDEELSQVVGGHGGGGWVGFAVAEHGTGGWVGAQ